MQTPTIETRIVLENGVESVETHQGLSNLDKPIDILIDGSNPLTLDR